MTTSLIKDFDKVKSKPNTTNAVTTTTAQNTVSSTPYEDSYKKIADVYKDGATDQKKYLENSYKQQITGINSDYDRTANQAYVQYRQNQKALPSQLSRMGMTGGATENANIKLQTAYGANLANNEFNRNKALSDASISYNDRVNAVDTNLNQTLAGAYSSAVDKDTTYGIQQQEKAEAAAKSAEINTHNDTVNKQIAEAQKEGYEVHTWVDTDGKLYFQKLQNTVQNQATIDEANTKAYEEIAALEKDGYEVKTWTDSQGRVYYSQMGNAKQEQETVDTYNNQAYEEIAKLEAQGYEVKVWNDSQGKIYYSPLGNSKQEQAALATQNNKTQSAVADLRRKGYDVLTWTDENGVLQYEKLNKLNADATALDKTNNKRQRAAATAQAEGYEVFTWTDERGYFHWKKGQKKTTSSGSGGSGDDEDGDDGGSGSGTTTNKYSTLSQNLANAMLKDSSDTARAYQADILETAYNNGELTEKQYKSLMKSIGITV